MKPNITTLFLDVGGVLLTNGWDHLARQQAATKFGLDSAELEARHQLNFATYEEGRLTLDAYLTRTVFYEDRAFTRDQFREFMFAQSQPIPGMIALFTELKREHGLKIAVVSNEARELNAYRIGQFKLGDFVDVFISSCFVRMRKPDTNIFQLALDITQPRPDQVVFIDNTLMFVQVAESMGMHGIHHTDYKTTCAALAEYGLQSAAAGS
ncbi:MAG: HAD family phosphatase [Sulfuriferula sp.]|nr:HAD family phosphatase [Sulfuriferula sp.]